MLALIPVSVAGVTGWGALSLASIQTDPARLLPPGSAAVASARTVARQTGDAGELDLVVTGPDVARPDVVAWLGAVASRLDGKGVRAVNGLPGFLLAFNYGKAPSLRTANAILSRLPRYFSQSVISPDHRAGLVTFGQPSVTSLTQDTQLIGRIGRLTAHPPAGYRAYPAGLAVVAAAALTLIAGFAALTLSPVPMLRGFGIWCAADLALAAVAVLLVLPPLTPRVVR